VRILHLNSMLSGGGTDDQCVKLAAALLQQGQGIVIAGPDGREFAPVIRRLGIPFFATGREGPAKVNLILRVAQRIRHEQIQIKCLSLSHRLY